jgi:RNA polymerase sigma-70 factor (ECF subfamily)
MSTKPEAPSDRELVEIARRDREGARGRAAANELLGRYRRRVYAWCFRMVREHETALDLAQEVLLSAWRGLPEFDARSQFSSWLFAIARNRCITALRPRILSRDASVDLEGLVQEADDPLDRLALIQEESAVLEAIRESLDPIEQDALWLRAVECLPVGEITRLLRIPAASGARAVLQSARRKLRARLGDRAEGR